MFYTPWQILILVYRVCICFFYLPYYHPGIRDANAGIIPGYFDANDNWYGSSGWMNSQLPQPGRAIYLQLMINIE